MESKGKHVINRDDFIFCFISDLIQLNEYYSTSHQSSDIISEQVNAIHLSIQDTNFNPTLSIQAAV